MCEHGRLRTLYGQAPRPRRGMLPVADECLDCGDFMRRMPPAAPVTVQQLARPVLSLPAMTPQSTAKSAAPVGRPMFTRNGRRYDVYGNDHGPVP